MSTKKKDLEKLVLQDRQNFQKLLAANPNYFGNLGKSKFKAAKKLISDTSFEELTCVGYNPNFNELHATFILKKDSGYSGKLCSKGSIQYIRFFVQYDTDWMDQGMATVRVHDISSQLDCFKDKTKPLSYTVAVKLKDLRKKRCSTPVLPKVRAILSWNQPIPPLPNYKPIWGNRLECRIQLKPYKFPLPLEVDDFLSNLYEKVVEFPDLSVNQLVTLSNEELGTSKSLSEYRATALPLAELVAAYSDKKGLRVPALRVSYPQLLASLESANSSNVLGSVFDGIPNLDIDDLILELDQTKANTDYEELKCIGLDYHRERLTATYKVKQNTGYLGGTCEKGSKEFVAFWADFDNDCKWTYLGTTAVEAFDIKQKDKDGLCYTAVLPYNFDRFRQVCDKPKVVRLRAVLSWNKPPSTVDPEALETYGNRLDTHILIKPGRPAVLTHPFFSILGGIAVDRIDDLSGLTKANASFALSGIAVPEGSPFAKRIVIQGPSFPGEKYRIQVRRSGELSWTNVVTPLILTGFDPITGTILRTPSAPDPLTQYFEYKPDNQNIDNILGWWDTNGDDKWEVKLDILGISRSYTKTIRLNHGVPKAEITINPSGSSAADKCGNFTAGAVVKGRFVARSRYLNQYSLNTNVNTLGTVLSPNSGQTNTASSPGNIWSLNLPAATPQCGYFVGLLVTDKTIINSSFVGFRTNAIVSFCVGEKE